VPKMTAQPVERAVAIISGKVERGVCERCTASNKAAVSGGTSSQTSSGRAWSIVNKTLAFTARLSGEMRR